MRCNTQVVIGIHRSRNPLLHRISQGAQWIGQDAFPAWPEWADEIEKWLRFIDAVGGLAHYSPRLRGPKERRDESLAEIAVIYFLAQQCALWPSKWEPIGAGSKKGEVLVALPDGGQMFVEVKSPGWEAEIARIEGRASPRLQKPKYIHAEGGSTEPVRAVRDSVAKAYPKMPSSLPTLLVINDDLMVPLHSWGNVVDIALYCKGGTGHHPSGYLAEDGCFVGTQYERLGGVGILNVRLGHCGLEYRFSVFDNPCALSSTAVPRTIFKACPRLHKPNWS